MTFVDSFGLRAILAAGAACAARGGRMVVIQGPPDVERLFALTGADQMLELVRHPSQAQAVLGSSEERRASHPLSRWSSFRSSAPASGVLAS